MEARGNMSRIRKQSKLFFIIIELKIFILSKSLF